jgi:hypothetical protein
MGELESEVDLLNSKQANSITNKTLQGLYDGAVAKIKALKSLHHNAIAKKKELQSLHDNAIAANKALQSLCDASLAGSATLRARVETLEQRSDQQQTLITSTEASNQRFRDELNTLRMLAVTAQQERDSANIAMACAYFTLDVRLFSPLADGSKKFQTLDSTREAYLRYSFKGLHEYAKGRYATDPDQMKWKITIPQLGAANGQLKRFAVGRHANFEALKMEAAN